MEAFSTPARVGITLVLLCPFALSQAVSTTGELADNHANLMGCVVLSLCTLPHGARDAAARMITRMQGLTQNELEQLWPILRAYLPHVSRYELDQALAALPQNAPVKLHVNPDKIEVETPEAVISMQRQL